MKANKDLRDLYDKVYNKGETNFFTFSSRDISTEVINELNYKNLEVLEIGCGTGETAFQLANAGSKMVTAFDYSFEAIKKAKTQFTHKNLIFDVKSIDDISEKYDCIIMQEVIEHTDQPLEVIKKLSQHLNSKGHLVLTCPSFVNLRGYVWMTLQTLLDVPMSLTDLHFFIPDDMIEYAAELNLNLTWRTFRHKQSHGEMMILDLKKRLKNALRDADLNNSKVDQFLIWLEKVGKYIDNEHYNGSIALYHFTPK